MNSKPLLFEKKKKKKEPGFSQSNGNSLCAICEMLSKAWISKKEVYSLLAHRPSLGQKCIAKISVQRAHANQKMFNDNSKMK